MCVFFFGGGGLAQGRGIGLSGVWGGAGACVLWGGGGVFQHN